MESLHFEYVIETKAALGGRVSVDVNDDGTWRMHLRMKSRSILEPFDFDVRAYLSAANFPTLVFRHRGHVDAGDGHNYDESGTDPYISRYWKRLKERPQFTVSKDYSVGGVLGTLAGVVDEILELIGGAAGAALGVVIGVSKEAVGWIGATLGPGGTLAVVGGVTVFVVAATAGAGLGAAVLAGVAAAVVICVATELVTDSRPLNAAERELARRVFGDTLPLDDIMLTSLGGAGGRGFTAQGVDGKTYLNLGTAFSRPLNPMRGAYPYPGQLLIHELTHAWQIHHGTFLPALMCSMLVTQTHHTFGDNAYDYGPPGTAWHDLNPEQQASIVDQWYAGQGHSDGWASMDQQNVYYRYVWDDVLGHAPPRAAPATLRTAADSRLTATTRTSWDPPPPDSGSGRVVTEHVDVFWAAGDGSLTHRGASSAADDLWSRPAGPVSVAGLTLPDCPVVALSRVPDRLEAFCINPEGAVVHHDWSGQVTHPTTEPFTPIAPAGSARTGSPLIALSRTPAHVDAFWVAPDGAIMSTWWDSDVTGIWTDHSSFPVTPPGAVQPGSGLAAASRLATHIDLFWVGDDGAIHTQWADIDVTDGGWLQHPTYSITASGAARAGSPVVAVARVPEHLDVFWIGPDGSIMTQWWDAAAGMGWADHGPFAIAAAGSAGTGCGLAAVGRNQLHLDVFWVRPDGAVMTQWWDAAPGCSWPDHPAYTITAAGAAHAGSPVAAVCSSVSHIDVFYVGSDGAVMRQWWHEQPGTGWADHAPQAVSPPGAIARDFATAKHAAAALTARSATLANIGDTRAATEASRSAVDVLVRADAAPEERVEYTRQLAMSWLDLVVRLAGRSVPELAAAGHEAVSACQQAVAAGNDPVTMASALRTLASLMSGAGATSAAVEAIDSAAGVLRAATPVAAGEVDYARTLALVLFDLFARQVEAGRPDLAQAPAREAVEAYRRLAAAGGDGIDAGNSLLTLSLRTSSAGLLDASADAARGAVDILGGVVPTSQTAALHGALLAQAQLVLAERLVAAGRASEALPAAQAAVALYQALAAGDVGYDGLLAQAQGVLASLAESHR